MNCSKRIVGQARRNPGIQASRESFRKEPPLMSKGRTLNRRDATHVGSRRFRRYRGFAVLERPKTNWRAGRRQPPPVVAISAKNRSWRRPARLRFNCFTASVRLAKRTSHAAATASYCDFDPETFRPILQWPHNCLGRQNRSRRESRSSR